MEKLVTNRELAEWSAKGKGEWMHCPSNSGVVYTTYKYVGTEADEPLTPNSEGQIIVVRKWEDPNWQLPTKKYILGKEE